MRRALLVGLLLLPACATTTPAASPDRLAELPANATARKGQLPPRYSYEVDRFGTVRVTGLKKISASLKEIAAELKLIRNKM